MLINAVLMGIYGFWAFICVLCKELIKQVPALCKNYLWGADYEYKKSPYVAWDSTCTPKKYGGLGVKNLECWNDACMAKLVWAVAMKKDIMWVK